MASIGIDLGTTNSLIAYWGNNGAEIIPNVLGENLTPSVVSIDEKGEIYVGQIAKERLITHPHLTAAAFKRFMGTEKIYKMGRYTLTPTELSSYVLLSLKADAEAFLGHSVNEAVISVPAYFNDTQRQATKKAAELAGLKVERLISEPTAAAMAYGLHQENTNTKFLVFDLGGGTFDVSILELFENVMEVKSIAGDNYLGGEDFNEALINYFCDRNSLELDNMSLKMKAAIYKQAEKCKCELSNNASSEMVYQADNSIYRVVIDRDTYEKITNPLLLRLRQPIERALHDAQLMPQELDAIILIGGSTRIASVRSVVSKVFGKLPLASINPDEAVALGAAIQAALKDGNKALDETILTDVCPYTLGTNIVKRINNRYEGGYFFPIIERNTPIPVSRVERLYTVSDNQSKIECGIYQGESRIVENNVKLGELCIDINPAPAGKESIDVRFTYDINGILEVEIVTVSTGEKKRVVIEKDPGKFSSKEIEQRLALLKKLKIHPRERTENRLLIAKAERLYEEALGEERNIIAYHIDVFESILDLQDEVKTKKAAEEFKKFLDTYEGQYEFR